MTLQEFNTALEIAYKEVIKKYGELHASTATISTITRGADAFDTQDQVINYMLASAKGDRHYEHKKYVRHSIKKAGFFDECERYAEPHDGSCIDLQRAIARQPDIFQEALHRYLIEGDTLKEVVKIIPLANKASAKRQLIRAICEIKEAIR